MTGRNVRSLPIAWSGAVLLIVLSLIRLTVRATGLLRLLLSVYAAEVALLVLVRLLLTLLTRKGIAAAGWSLSACTTRGRTRRNASAVLFLRGAIGPATGTSGRGRGTCS